jgi:hypothetical protein
LFLQGGVGGFLSVSWYLFISRMLAERHVDCAHACDGWWLLTIPHCFIMSGVRVQTWCPRPNMVSAREVDSQSLQGGVGAQHDGVLDARRMKPTQAPRASNMATAISQSSGPVGG